MNNLTITAIVVILGMLAYAIYSLVSSTSSTEVPSTTATQETSVDLSSMTKSELVEYAKSNDIKVNTRNKKADIITAIESSQS